MENFFPKSIKNMQIRGFEKEKIDSKNHISSESLCDRKKWIRKESPFSKETFSYSTQSHLDVKKGSFDFLSHFPKKVFAKTFPLILEKESVYGENDNSFEREVAILRYLSYLVKYSITPCIVKHLADFNCKISDEKTLARVMKIFPDNQGTKKSREKFKKSPMVKHLILEYLKGPFIGDWIRTNPDIEDFKSILFQVLYTCHQLYLSGVQHNDLHLENIIIVKNKDPQPLLFITKDYSVSVSGNYIAKIFDFDRGVFYKGYPVKSIGLDELCETYGVCPEENRARDQINILTWIYSSVKTSENKNLLEYMDNFSSSVSSDPLNIIKKGTSKYKKVHTGVLCLETEKCKNWVPSEKLFNTFDQMVEKDAFLLGFERHKNPEELKKLVEKQLLYCGRIYMGLDVEESKRKILIHRTKFPYD